MKWFKHYANAADDEKIAALEERAGLEGYGFYFRLLEKICKQVDEKNISELCYSSSRWARELNITTKKFLFLSQCCADVGLITIGRCDDVDATTPRRAPDDYLIAAPNLLKYRDNHSKNLQAKNKNKEEDIDKEEDKETERKNITPTPLAGGQTALEKNSKPKSQPKPKPAELAEPEWWPRFWEAYPRREDKQRALKKWREAINAGADPENLALCAEAYAARCEKEKREMTFIRLPATWLNNKNWADFQDEVDAANDTWTEDDNWRVRMRIYSERGIWPADVYGARPGQPGCCCPPNIIQEFSASTGAVTA